MATYEQLQETKKLMRKAQAGDNANGNVGYNRQRQQDILRAVLAQKRKQQEEARKKAQALLIKSNLNKGNADITPLSMAKTAANVANGNAVNAFQSQPESGIERVADTVSGAVKTGIASIGNAHRLATGLMTKPTTALLDAVTNHKYNIGGAVNSIHDQLNAPVNRLMESGESNTESAKRGLGKLGRAAVDIGGAATQLAMTAGMGAAAGGGARALQAVQQAGQGAYEAKKAGAGEGKQALYGILQGATAYATEGISNFGALGKIFGNGAVDSKIEQASAKAISKFVSSDAGRAVANRLATGAEAGLGEALEQNIQDALTPIYQKLTYDPDAKWNAEEMLYNGLVAGALGGIVGSAGKNNLYTAEKNYDAQPALKEFMERYGAQEKFANETAETRTKEPINAENGKTGIIEQTQATKGTAIDTNPLIHTPEQQKKIIEYQGAVNKNLLQFAQQYIDNPQAPFERLNVSKVGERQAADAKNLVGGDYANYQNAINKNSIIHMENRHGANGTHDSSMADVNDLARAGYVLDNYDTVERIKLGSGEDDLSAEFRNADDTPAPLLKYSKKIDGTYYVVEAVPDSKYKKFWIVSAYIEAGNKSGGTVTQAPTVNTAGSTSETSPVSLDSTNNIILQSSENINPNLQGGELGAANSGFDPYTHLQNQFGNIPVGENPARIIDVPLKTSDNMNVSRGVRTAMEAKVTPDAALGDIQNAVVGEKFSFETIKDRDAASRAQAKIAVNGYETSLRDWTAEARSGKVSKDLMAQGQALYNSAVNAGDYKTGVDILTDYVKMSRSGAQATQANRMLKQMDPQYQLYALERQSQNISDELMQKFKKSGFEGIKLNEDLVKQFSEAPDQTARDAIMDELKQNVADQIPSSWKDKWNAWRYLSMLGNPRTHIRNIVGTAGFVPVRVIKNIIGAGIEKATGADRTKSVLTWKDKDLVKYAAKDYAAVSDQIMQNGKFDDLRSDIDSRKTIYKNPLLETLRKGNNAALDAEDVWFAKPAYANSLAGYYKANGITAEALSDGRVPQTTIDKARAYAIKEAQKATYRDSNDFSDWISRIGKYHGENKAAKIGSTALDAILPFRRTPANILARAWEYSPGEFLNVLGGDIRKVKAGDMGASEMIDHISSGMTGTMLLGLGAYLASQGILTGGKSDNDDENALNEQMGYQDYALNIGGKSITLDWLVPEALPLFTGAELFQTTQQKSDGKITLAKLLTNFGNMAEPMIDMSMLQGVNDLFDSIKYSKDNNILSIAATTASNYLSQALPTLGGQIERIGEKERQTTYVDKTSGVPTALQYMLGKAANKIPGVEYQQRPYTDMFGQHQSTGNVGERAFNNLFNPAYVRNIEKDDVTDELSRLVKGKYFSNVAGAPEQQIKYGGEEHDLNKEEYTKYAEKIGQLEHAYANAMMENGAYSEMSDTQKADYLQQMFTYAKDEAKRDYVTDKGADYESQLDTVYKAQQAGIEPDSYYAYKKYLSDISGKESGTQAQEAQAVNKLDLTQRMKGELWAIQNATSDASKNPFTGTAAQTGIAPEIVIDVQTACSEYTADKDKNGKSINGTKRAKQLAYINSQNLTVAQKDALYRSVGLAESTLRNAPWH